MAVNPILNADSYSYVASDGTLQETEVNSGGGGGGGGAGGEVEVTNFPVTQAVLGPLTDAELRAAAVPVSGTVTVNSLATAGSTQQGAIANAPYTDATGAASGTMIALLKGLYVQNVSIISLLNDIKNNTASS